MSASINFIQLVPLTGSGYWRRFARQLASVSNALTEIAGFGFVDVATRVVHLGIRNLRLQMAWVVFGQNNISQVECLLTEIPVSPDSLFGGQLTNVIVEQAKRARD